MDKKRLNRFKELLSVPTQTYRETQMINHILGYVKTLPDILDVYTDHKENIYITKGVLEKGEYYPMFIAHTDTVHTIDTINVVEEQHKKPHTFGINYDDTKYTMLKAYNDEGNPTGIGGDDKNGIFIALELLQILPKVKVGLFVSEETGCIGSSECDVNFLQDVGYAVQFDCPTDKLITETCSGIKLFDKDSKFFKTIKNVFVETMEIDRAILQNHPYTDVSQIKKKGDFACINLACGYYNMHTKSEMVCIDDVEKSINVGKEIVNKLGLTKHTYEAPKITYGYYDDYDDYESETEMFINNYEVIFNDNHLTINDTITKDSLTFDEYEVEELYDMVRMFMFRQRFSNFNRQRN